MTSSAHDYRESRGFKWSSKYHEPHPGMQKSFQTNLENGAMGSRVYNELDSDDQEIADHWLGVRFL